MRNLILAGLAATMLAGPVLADPHYGEHDRGRHEGGEFRGDDRRDFRDDRRDDRRDWHHDRYADRHDNWRQNDWRQNDWRWNGTRYRGPAYAYPRGYAYQPWGVGVRLAPAYYDRPYWIGNPDYYRLPVAGYGARWVRVGPDALLIRIGDGIVIRAVRGLYW